MRFWPTLIFCLMITLTVPPGAFAQQGPHTEGAVLWIVNTSDSVSVEQERVVLLLTELMASVQTPTHIIGHVGLSSYLSRHGFPLPDCLTGYAPCPDPVQAVADVMHIAQIATVTVHGAGERMDLSLRPINERSALEYSIEGRNLSVPVS